MEENYTTYPDNAKVWVYQSNQQLDKDEEDYLKVQLDDFVSSWESHGKLVKATFEIVHHLFVVIFVDEQGDKMCGTAQDNSIRLMKQLGAELEVDFLNRMTQSYKKGDQVKIVQMNDFSTLLANNEIDENTIVFNNMVTTKYDFENHWEVPLKESWHKQLLVIS
ncbi:MAG: ABC transporter ATPase [Flavobacteriales bacterium CG_4_10_14_0_2_um_filter_32_8]|nr:MAG: ABC transporter ATPase [Flavobacteriales bacterium CG_4_10_14_0_2_um_filter_32_8]PJB15410.1 MAG: ABC transporter ATPase [Flavobacteriales bacterium CG_4_9_14_3_um_filter_32_8]